MTKVELLILRASPHARRNPKGGRPVVEDGQGLRRSEGLSRQTSEVEDRVTRIICVQQYVVLRGQEGQGAQYRSKQGRKSVSVESALFK